MKKVLLLLLVMAGLRVSAQKIEVSGATETVGKTEHVGLKTVLTGNASDVADAWKDYLKTFRGKGKVEDSKKMFTNEAAEIKTLSEKPVRVVSKVDDSGKGQSMVFCAFDLGTGYVNSADSHYGAAEKFMRDFAVAYYKKTMGSELADAEKGFAAATRLMEKKAAEEADLKKDLDNNQKQLTDLQKKIEDNKRDRENLLRKTEENKVEKEKAIKEAEKSRLALETVKAKMGEIK
jgi:hypothetical protein